MTPGRGDFRSLPKAELHAHLNGSVPVDTVRQMGGGDDDYVISSPVADLTSYFQPWALARRLANSRAGLTTLVNGVARRFGDDGVTYAEVRNSVRHLAGLNGITWAEAIGWLLDALDDASDSAVDLRLIVTLTREGFDNELASRMLDACVPFADHSRLVGLDLAGDETLPMPDDASAIFRRGADEIGLGITIHAGELPGLSNNILWALHECRAVRLGHAIAAVDNDRVLDALAASGACVEVCLTSNWLTSSVKDLSRHPVKTFLDRGVEFVLCADNPGVHDLYLSHEYLTFVEVTGRTDVIEQMHTRQTQFAFANR